MNKSTYMYIWKVRKNTNQAVNRNYLWEGDCITREGNFIFCLIFLYIVYTFCKCRLHLQFFKRCPASFQKYEVDFWQERVMWKGRKHSLTPSVYLCHLPTQGPPEKGGSASSPFVSCATVLPKTFLKMQKKKKKWPRLWFLMHSPAFILNWLNYTLT